MRKTKEEIFFNDFSFVCDQLYRLVVEGKEMQITYKEMFAFLEQVLFRLKEQSDMSKLDIGISDTRLSDGRSAGELLRSLSSEAILQKLIKLDHMETLRREKNRKRRVNQKRESESSS